MLTAERRVGKYDKKGQLSYVWVKEKQARNEALDCRVYAWAAMQGLIYERRLDIQKIAQARQFSLFKGDALTPPATDVEASPIPMQAPAPVVAMAATAHKNNLKRRASGRSGYVRR